MSNSNDSPDKAYASEEAHRGGCLCGAIRYRVLDPIDAIVHCHCSMCRRASGAVAVTWLTLPKDRFTVTKGELAAWNSSDHGTRTFCPECGGQITFWSSERPDELDVTLCTLDQPERFPARHHVYTTAKLPWLHLDENLPEYPEQTPHSGDTV